MRRRQSQLRNGIVVLESPASEDRRGTHPSNSAFTCYWIRNNLIPSLANQRMWLSSRTVQSHHKTISTDAPLLWPANTSCLWLQTEWKATPGTNNCPWRISDAAFSTSTCVRPFHTSICIPYKTFTPCQEIMHHHMLSTSSQRSTNRDHPTSVECAEACCEISTVTSSHDSQGSSRP